MNAVALLSGGLDSSTALAIALDMRMNVTDALTVSYGQRHDKEVYSAQNIANHYKLQWSYLRLDAIGQLIKRGSALVNPDEPLPQDRSPERMTKDIPRSYVPGRNTLLLAIAQAFAESHELERIIVGFNAVDYSGYPDCRPEFVTAWNSLAERATRVGVQHKPICVVAPIIEMTKPEIIHIGLGLRVPYELTWSCYAGEPRPCGRCDSCIIRANGFAELGVPDPLLGALDA